jgi:2-phospho-L-lactate guanylyltransferase
VTTNVRWSVIVPVKRLDAAKSRLAVDPQLRRALALAMATDTVAAAAAVTTVARVVVVCEDDAVAAALAHSALTIRAESCGLAAALRRGVEYATSLDPDAGIAVVVGDLPAATPAELAAVLDDATQGVVVVADVAGTGSTMVAAPAAAPMPVAFGRDSFARHVALGAHAFVASPIEGVRRDVDTVDDLQAAQRLGLGSATRALLEEKVRAGTFRFRP